MHYQILKNRYDKQNATDQPIPWDKAKINLAMSLNQWRPAADIYETKDTISVIVDLAGVKATDITVTFYEDALVIEGVRNFQYQLQKGTFHLAEVQQGPFKLELILPNLINAESMKERYEDGLLWISLAKQTQERVRL
ncbi:MAG: Hsp20/alpha crystallin family protein [Chlamydiales bacterium]|jgi:HSP20 family protein|nr:Hsp20/alpha crystallin family protein [Chlamydiales bacterium]